jgi:AcrR family transcriptional regulator
MAEKARLDRADWLDAALDALHEEGESGVRVEPLARRLGVTKGSFYHHFRDREELLGAMIDRWQATQETHIANLAGSRSASAADHIAEILDFTKAKDSRHDVGMRAWALHHAPARRALLAIDRLRLGYVEQVFAELGFAKDEAKLRARLLYFYQVGEYTLAVRDRDELRDRLKQLRFELLAHRS